MNRSTRGLAALLGALLALLLVSQVGLTSAVASTGTHRASIKSELGLSKFIHATKAEYRASLRITNGHARPGDRAFIKRSNPALAARTIDPRRTVNTGRVTVQSIAGQGNCPGSNQQQREAYIEHSVHSTLGSLIYTWYDRNDYCYNPFTNNTASWLLHVDGLSAKSSFVSIGSLYQNQGDLGRIAEWYVGRNISVCILKIGCQNHQPNNHLIIHGDLLGFISQDGDGGGHGL